MSIIKNTNLTNFSDLIFYLDAGNIKSYPGTGSTWFDLSGNSNHFTLFNSPTFTRNGSTGTYFTFNGSNQYVRSNTAVNLNNYSALTIEIGFRSTATLTQVLYETTGTGGSTTTGGISLLMNSNNTSTNAQNCYLSFWQGYGPRFFAFQTNTTTFYSVAEVFVKGVDREGRRSYVNSSATTFITNAGVTTSTFTTTSGVSFSNTWTFIASRDGARNFFTGDIAYVRAWGTKFSTTEIDLNFRAVAARQPQSYQPTLVYTSEPGTATGPATNLTGIFTGAGSTFIYAWSDRWTTVDTQPTGGWSSITGGQGHFVSGFGFSATPTSASISSFLGANLSTYQNSNRSLSAVTAPQGSGAGYTVSSAINFATNSDGAWLENNATRTLQFTIASSFTDFGNATGFISQAYGGGGGYHKCFVFSITHGGITRLFAPKYSVNYIVGSNICYLYYPLKSDFTSFTDARLTGATGNTLTASYFEY